MKKHIVYLIKINREEIPNRYIGSKSNCDVIDGKIIGRGGIPYIGSSKDKTYKSIIEEFGYTLQILGNFEKYDDALQMEKSIHILYDVVASPIYFNKSIATISTYSHPDYGTYKHSITGKIVRLKRDHPGVLSEEWVGVTKGVKFTYEERMSRGRAGTENGFFGKKHTEETKQICGKKIGDAHRGKPKTIEQRAKMAEARRLYWARRKENNEGRKEESL